MSIAEDESAVRRLIAKFANSFDVKAWDDLGECLADPIYADYSELRGTPPESISRRQFVEQRRASLENTKTHILTSNVEVYINGTSATARVTALVYRRRDDGQTFNTHCFYLLGLQSIDAQWTICSIVQKVLWNEGGWGLSASGASRQVEN